jgi:hypothetical protein
MPYGRVQLRGARHVDPAAEASRLITRSKSRRLGIADLDSSE